MQYEIIAFYKFVPLADYLTMQSGMVQFMRDEQIKGTIVLASEGINGTCCGNHGAIANFMVYLNNALGVQDITYKKSFNNYNPFTKAKVKLRPEIVTMGKSMVNPLAITGEYVAPQYWNALISDPNVMVIDTRNTYEVQLGTFKNAIDPETENFRDFPDYVEKNLVDCKNKKIAMFCTGGIRCEKSTAYLKQLGFKQVYQLDGGILNYLEVIDSQESLWQGSCFVFDERVAVDGNLNSLEAGTIDPEWKNTYKKQNHI